VHGQEEQFILSTHCCFAYLSGSRTDSASRSSSAGKGSCFQSVGSYPFVRSTSCCEIAPLHAHHSHSARSSITSNFHSMPEKLFRRGSGAKACLLASNK